MRVVDLKRVSQEDEHCAFTDLVNYRNQYYLTYRACPGGHMLFASSRVIVLRSPDGETWRKVLEQGVPGRDVRYPHFLVVGDKLAVYSGAWPVNEADHTTWTFALYRAT